MNVSRLNISVTSFKDDPFLLFFFTLSLQKVICYWHLKFYNIDYNSLSTGDMIRLHSCELRQKNNFLRRTRRKYAFHLSITICQTWNARLLQEVTPRALSKTGVSDSFILKGLAKICQRAAFVFKYTPHGPHKPSWRATCRPRDACWRPLIKIFAGNVGHQLQVIDL